MRKIFIQIGTKDGNDEFNMMVRLENPSLVILIEPNREHNADIWLNYEDVPVKIHLENVAITTEDSPEVTLVRPDHPINSIEYDSGKYSLLPMDDWGDSFIRLKAPGMTFNSLCEKYHIDHVSFLQIDTEGYDAEIIKSIDFDKVTIDKIKYEVWHFPVDRFTRHGAKGLQYGWAGMEAVGKLLADKGYTFERLPYDIIATRG